MKKLTILLAIVTIIIFGVCYVQEKSKIPEQIIPTGTTNKQLSNYAGIKVRGSNVKALFRLVENLNEQQIYPVNIRYGDVLPNSYDWSVPTTQNLYSGDRDSIRDSAWYEVVMQDQLPEGKIDGYIDTIAIRSYGEVQYKNNDFVSGERIQNEYNTMEEKR